MAFTPSGTGSAKPSSVAGVVIPDRKLAREVTELVKDTEPAAAVPSLEPCLSLGRAYWQTPRPPFRS